MKKIKLHTLQGIFIYALLLCVCPFISYTEKMNKWIAIAVLILSVIVVYKCRNNILLLILSVFIAYSNYSIVVGIYLDPTLRPKYLYPQIQDVQVYGMGITLLLFFMIALLSFLPSKINKRSESFVNIFVKAGNFSVPIFLVLSIAFFLILIFGYTRATAARGVSSAIYEYDIIFLILMFYYSGNKRHLRWVCYIGAMLYVLTSFMNGTRVEALSCLLVVCFCTLKKKIPTWAALLGFLVGIIIMNFIGILRGNYSSFSVGLGEAISNLWTSKLVFDTCTHAYFPALCMIEQFKEYSLREGMYFFSRFLLTIFAGQSRVPDGDLIAYVRNFYYHNYGGVTTGFFYVWFSFWGPLIYGQIVGFFIKFVNSDVRKSTPVKKCAMLYVISTVPRWYLYGPWSFSRGMLICCIVFVVIGYVKKAFLTRNIKKRNKLQTFQHNLKMTRGETHDSKN